MSDVRVFRASINLYSCWWWAVAGVRLAVDVPRVDEKTRSHFEHACFLTWGFA